VSRSARHRKAARPAPPRRYKAAGIALAAVAVTALAVAASPAAIHWLKRAPHPAGAAQADALGLPTAGAHRGAASPRPTAPGTLASPQPQIVSLRVAKSRRHRKPAQAGYLNPLRAISGLVPERIDEGVDFAGTGPVYALGDGVVTSESQDSGWPGWWITYQLTDGPDAGLMVYVAEDVTPDVQVGQHVTPATVVATMVAGADGIETGWAQQSAVSAESELPEAGGVGAGGPFPTEVGVSFEGVLVALGVPAAPNLGQAASGILPAGYPAG